MGAGVLLPAPFELPDSFAGLRTFVDFAGALTKAVVHLNGVELGVHLGGYLPSVTRSPT